MSAQDPTPRRARRPPRPPRRPSPRARVLGGCRLGKVIARGGMSTVFEGSSLETGERLAVKVLAPRYSRDERFVDRFFREARWTLSLQHPHIVAGYELGVEGRRIYVVLERVEGETLAARIRRGPLDELAALQICAAVARALAYCHGRGLIHRDVKPENVLLGVGGEVKLCDLGLTRSLIGDEDDGLTSTGATLGTPRYISPEQARGQRDLDGRADIFSLGVVLYHMLVGALPFAETQPLALVIRYLHDPIPAPSARRPGLAPSIDALVARMTAIDRRRRYADAGELLRDLERLIGHRAHAATD